MEKRSISISVNFIIGCIATIALGASVFLYTTTYNRKDLETAFGQRDQVINNIGHALELVMKKTGVKPEDVEAAVKEKAATK